MSGLWPCYQRVHEGKDRDTDFAGDGNPPPGKRAVQPGYRADCGAGQCRERCNHRCHRKQSRNIGRLLVVSTSTSTT